ncbi:MAG: exostosin family protein [Aquabacterium sp.]|nr:exostosin family protein [Aquabacterium sp.]
MTAISSSQVIQDALPVISVYGPRRSGVKVISKFLLSGAKHPIANFDENPGHYIADHPSSLLLFPLCGSKHSLSDRPLEKKYLPGSIYIFAFKPLASWVYSRVAHQRTYADVPASEISDFVRRIIEVEYLSMLDSLVVHLDGPLSCARVFLVNFDAIAADGFESLLDRLGLDHQAPIEGIREPTMATGASSARYKQRCPEELVPETYLHAEILDICAKALAGCKASTMSLYGRIFGMEPAALVQREGVEVTTFIELDQPLVSFWMGRFTVRYQGQSNLLLKDRLHPEARVVPRALFAGLPPHTRDLTYFRLGFIRPVLGAVGATVVEAGPGPDDLLAWLGPACTEQAAMAAHAGVAGPLLADGAMHVYLGLPWATWIDRMLPVGHGNDGELPAAAVQQLQLVGIQLLGYRHALAELGTQLRVHTVCQHVQWPQMLAAWRELGVTDLWLSHCPEEDVPGFNVHPWRLGASQFEDLGQSGGLPLMADPETKPLLASFVGHLSDQLTDDIHPRLAELSADKRVRIALLPAAPAPADAAAPAWPETAVGNQVLSESVFSLCPAGAGTNTSRLWESLAVGAVPVLIGGPSAQPRLPEGGSLPALDWSSIVLRVSADDLAELPALLGSMPMDEVRRRQQLGRDAFEQVCRQRCF